MEGINLKVLLIGECYESSKILRCILENDGHEVGIRNMGIDGIRDAETKKPDVVLVDMSVSDCKGMEVIKKINAQRDKYGTPFIIAILDNYEEEEIVELFINGANDFMEKSYDLIELCMKISAIEKILNKLKYKEKTEEENTLKYKDIELGLNEPDLVKERNTKVKVSRTEYDLIRYFLSNNGKILSREQILLNVWKDKYYEVTDRTVDTCIYRIRMKLKQLGENIETVSGFGYRLKRA